MSPRERRSDGHGRVEIATRRAVMVRDAGLARISTVTRWTIAGIVALSGGLALIAADAFHGRTLTSTPSSSTATTPQPPVQSQATTSQNQTSSSSSQTGLAQPSQAPAPTPAAPVVVSGGS